MSKALQIYEKVRIPIIRRAFENTRNCGLIFEGRIPPAPGLDQSPSSAAESSKYDGRTISTERLTEYGEDLNRLYSWQWTEPTVNDEQWVVAEKMLGEALQA